MTIPSLCLIVQLIQRRNNPIIFTDIAHTLVESFPRSVHNGVEILGHLRFQAPMAPPCTHNGNGLIWRSTPQEVPCALTLATAFLGKWNINLLFLIAMLWENMATSTEHYEIKIPGRLLRVSKMKENLKVTFS